MRFFFYGTLLDRDVRRVVLGRPVRLALRPGVLRGWRAVATGQGAYPILLRAPGQRVRGAVALGIGRADAIRLDRYEGEGYGRRGLHVRGTAAPAQVYLPVPGHPHDGRPWRLDVWRRRRKRGFLAAVGANRGTAPPAG